MPAVAVAAAAAYASSTVVTTFALTGFAAALATAGTSLAVSQIGGSILGLNTPPGGVTPTGALNTTLRQATAARRLVYGTIKTGGILVYPGQTSDGAAHLVIAVCEGEIDGFDATFWLGEDLSTDSKFSGLITAQFKTGTASQTAFSDLVTALPAEWTSAHRLRGIACAYIKYEFDRNAFPSGLVFPTFLVRGRKVFDPRDESTAYSANPALCLLDYLRSPYSVAAPDDLIDFDSFAAAASVCDEVLDSADTANEVDSVPGKVLRYTFNGAVESVANPAQVIETFEASCAGKLVFTQGKYRFYAGAYRAPTGPVLTSEYLRDAPAWRPFPARQQRVNIVRGTYREPRQNWQDTDYAEQTMGTTVVAAEGEIIQSINLPATTQGAIAQRLAKIAMLRARATTPLQLRCNWAALQWRLYSTVAVDLPQLGIATTRTWVVTEYSFPEGGGVDMTLLPDDAAHYAWDEATDEQLVEDVPTPEWGTDPAAISGLAVTGSGVTVDEDVFRPTLQATWTASTDPFFKEYEVQSRENGATDWLTGGTVTAPIWTDAYSVAGVAYDVRVRLVRTDGTVGAWAQVLNTTVDGA